MLHGTASSLRCRSPSPRHFRESCSPACSAPRFLTDACVVSLLFVTFVGDDRFGARRAVHAVLPPDQGREPGRGRPPFLYRPSLNITLGAGLASSAAALHSIATPLVRLLAPGFGADSSKPSAPCSRSSRWASREVPPSRVNSTLPEGRNALLARVTCWASWPLLSGASLSFSSVARTAQHPGDRAGARAGVGHARGSAIPTGVHRPRARRSDGPRSPGTLAYHRPRREQRAPATWSPAVGLQGHGRYRRFSRLSRAAPSRSISAGPASSAHGVLGDERGLAEMFLSMTSSMASRDDFSGMRPCSGAACWRPPSASRRRWLPWPCSLPELPGPCSVGARLSAASERATIYGVFLAMIPAFYLITVSIEIILGPPSSRSSTSDRASGWRSSGAAFIVVFWSAAVWLRPRARTVREFRPPRSGRRAHNLL